MNACKRTVLAACILAALQSTGNSNQAHGPAAAAVPSAGLPGPTVMVVQEQTLPGGTRFTTWDEAAQSWSPWAAGPAISGTHYDMEIPAIACHLRDNPVRPRFDVFYATVDPNSGAAPFPIVATAERHKPSEAVAATTDTLPIRNSGAGSLFFPASARGWNAMQTVSILGTSVHFDPTNGDPLFRVREVFNNGNSESTRDITDASYPGADFIQFSSHAIATWEEEGTRAFSRTAVWHERLSYLQTGNVTLVHTKGERNGRNGILDDTNAIVQLGTPPARIVGPPLLLTQSGYQPGNQNVFVVAEDRSGRRHLFERHNPTNDPADANAWSEWRDHGFPAMPDGVAPAKDDLSVTAALVWKDEAGSLRINLFGQRWGWLVEYWWNGGSWSWSTSARLPSALQGCAITSSAVAPTGTTGRPRLSIFAVDTHDHIWERVWSWSAGTWDWKAIN